MTESPRNAPLRSDLRALNALRADSSILEFDVHAGELAPEAYLVRFQGTGTWKPAGTHDVLLRDRHEVLVRLGANYPRMMPELTWKTPIFHPNISSSGFVCLGGYGTFWAPSLNLDDLCIMLWDMVRYANYDVNSPYNREAALWVKTQQFFQLPLDPRPLRDRRAGSTPVSRELPPRVRAPAETPAQPDILFLDEVVEAEIVEAEIVEERESDVLIID